MTADTIALAAAIARVEAEYRDMPGMRLTEAQLRRLCGLDASTCRRVVEVLETAGVLGRTGDDKLALSSLERLAQNLRC
jgi:hypothetical protein